MAAVIIAGLCCAALVFTVLFKPEITVKKVNIPIYPLVALLGAIASVAFTPLTFSDCIDGIVGSGAVNPLKILTLFISVTAISIFLDEAGLFEYLACRVLAKAGGNQAKLFFLLYLSVSVLTVFTSNDIIILTFTPFIIYFCKNAEIKALPYLMAEFTAANTWSMAFIIGNPTNIYLATGAGIDFFAYAKIMVIPTLFTGLCAGGILYLLFRKSLKEPFVPKITLTVLKDKPLCILGVIVLAVCTVSLAISSYIGIEMYLECIVCAGVLFISALLICCIRHQRPDIVGHTLKRLPYELIPFVLSMFVISLSLNKAGITKILADAMSGHQLILYGVSSFLASNLVNNIPMSVIFSSIIIAGDASKEAVFASIIGSNLGALLTPVGALAGIMFSSINKKHGEKFSALTFIKYGSAVSIATLAVALASLALTVYVIF